MFQQLRFCPLILKCRCATIWPTCMHLSSQLVCLLTDTEAAAEAARVAKAKADAIAEQRQRAANVAQQQQQRAQAGAPCSCSTLRPVNLDENSTACSSTAQARVWKVPSGCIVGSSDRKASRILQSGMKRCSVSHYCLGKNNIQLQDTAEGSATL